MNYYEKHLRPTMSEFELNSNEETPISTSLKEKNAKIDELIEEREHLRVNAVMSYAGYLETFKQLGKHRLHAGEVTMFD
jgi:hypothetical protein